MPRLGILAGAGGLPATLANSCRRDGREAFILGFKGQTDKALSPHAWTRLGGVASTLKILRENGVDTLVLAGAVRRPRSWLDLRPDWRGMRLLAKLALKTMGDDALLRAVAAELEQEGFTLIGAHEVEPALLAPAGVLGKITPTPAQEADIAAGITATKTHGARDAGQAAVVRGGAVAGLEGQDGTDALVRRCAGKGGVLVKSCKPGQDRRLDLPSIGPRTVRTCHEAGLSGIAVEAGSSLVIDREQTVAAADAAGLFITGFTA